MKKLTPVVLFVYNRPDKARNVIESLRKCELCEETDLYIFADAPLEHRRQDRVQVEKVWGYLDELQSAPEGFRSITVCKAPNHRGLAKSVIDGVSKVIKKYKQVIVVEDDLLLAPNFLEYMNHALWHYRHDKKIWSVTGYTPSLDGLKDRQQDVYFSYRGSSWGWGTWINRWEKVDWEVKDYKQFEWNLYKQWKLNRGGNDLARMLMRYMQGKNNSWAVRWCYEASKRNMLTVYPVETMVLNDGFDGSGTHCSGKAPKQMKLQAERKEFEMSERILDSRLLKEFKQHSGVSTKEWLKYYVENLLGLE